MESLDQTISLAKEKGVAILGEPVQPNPHVRFAFIKDPNGMRVQLVENLG